MGAKKIIIPIAIAAVVGVGVGFYCYNTVKANNLSVNETESISSNNADGSITLSSTNSTTNNTAKDTTINGVSSKKTASTTGTATSNVASKVNTNSNTSNTTISSNKSNAGTSSSTSTVSDTKSVSSKEHTTTTKTTSSNNTTSNSNQLPDAKPESLGIDINGYGYIGNLIYSTYVSVYEKPDASSTVIQYCDEGQQVYVVSQNLNWTCIRLDGEYFYVKSSNVTFINPEDVANSSCLTNFNRLNETGKAEYYSVTCVNRMSPQGLVVGSFEDDYTFNIVGEDGNYYIVSMGIEGEYAFVLKSEVDVITT